MSFTEVLAELPALTFFERQLLIRRALDLDELPLSAKDEAVVEERLKDHRVNPACAVRLEDMKARLRALIAKSAGGSSSTRKWSRTWQKP